VRGRATPVEQPGASEQERSRADRGHPPRALGGGAQPGDQPLVVDGVVHPAPAGHEQRVDGAAALVEGAVGVERDAGGAQRALVGGDDLGRIAVAARQPRRGAEDFGRAEDVQGLDAWKGSDDDPVHWSMVAAARLGRKDTHRTISARRPAVTQSGAQDQPGVKRNVTTSPSRIS
jgi:hypothetical protein